MTIGDRGRFPFGQPNTARPMRLPPTGPAAATVLGVYPSAFHVAWRPPESLDDREPGKRTRPLIASLAVDVEPTVFWDGVDPSPAVLLEHWRQDVGFEEERHGQVSLGHNGPSGTGLVADILSPLELPIDQVAFTDALPWFFTKAGKGGQRDAWEQRFLPVAGKLGVHPGSLPRRPSARQLVAHAGSPARRDDLRQELLTADAPVLITLGQEALDALSAVADELSGVSAVLTPDTYGAVGEVSVDGHRWLLVPLVHPGFQRQTKDEGWRVAFKRWSDVAPTLLR